MPRLAAKLGAPPSRARLLWARRQTPFSISCSVHIAAADVRSAGLESGLVDNKIAAIDESWSGLRFVRRLADR